MSRFPRFALRILLLFALVVGALIGGTHGVRAQEEVPPSDEARELALIQLINQTRTESGLWPLKRSAILTASARSHAIDVQTHGLDGSTGSDGSTPADRAVQRGFQPYGWGSAYVGESLAMGYATAQDIFAALMSDGMNSANILNPLYREIGVGYLSGGLWANYWVVDFGSQPSVLPVTIDASSAVAYSSDVQLSLTNETVSTSGSVGEITQVAVSASPDFSASVELPWQGTLPWVMPCDPPWGQVYVRYTDSNGATVRASDRILCGLREAGGLSDVGQGAWYDDAVTMLYRVLVINGYADGTFRPEREATRAEALTLLVRSQGWPLTGPIKPTFSDVPWSHWAFAYVETAAAHGVVSGYPDGTFRPDAPVTRAELITMVLRVGGWPPLEQGSAVKEFPDVPADFWAAGFIRSGVAHGLISGNVDGTFAPDENSSRAALASMVAKMLLLQEDRPLEPSGG